MIPSITGIGVTSAIGQGVDEFWPALLQGKSQFSIMQREGRQRDTRFIGAEISNLRLPENLPLSIKRAASFSAQVALATVTEAWQSAELDRYDPTRIGLIIGGSNLQQRELFNQYASYADRLDFIRPSYAVSFMDTDICGLCTQQLGIQGPSFSVGGASASGQLAFIQAAQAVQNGSVDICIAVGGLMDLSFLECQAFRSLGAMGSDRFSEQPEIACRPFDSQRDGFIYGESCAALVLQNPQSLDNKSRVLAQVPGWSIAIDANQGPAPSFSGEKRAIENALTMSAWSAQDIDYINPHGSASGVGDETEIEVIRACGLTHAHINSTKSITGHGLSAAGAVELVASVLQLHHQQLHPCLNLDNPICSDMNWVRKETNASHIERALNISLGFGGMNTAVCLTH